MTKMKNDSQPENFNLIGHCKQGKSRIETYILRYLSSKETLNAAVLPCKEAKFNFAHMRTRKTGFLR